MRDLRLVFHLSIILLTFSCKKKVAIEQINIHNDTDKKSQILDRASEESIHCDKGKEVDKDQQISLKISFEDNSTEEENSFLRDTIIPIDSLNDNIPFFILGFNYPKIKEKTKTKNEISFENGKNKISVKRKKVNILNYTVTKENGYLEIIPKKGFEVYGNYGLREPEYVIDSINIMINDEKINICGDSTTYLFEPLIDEAELYKKGNNQYILHFRGGDGMEGYDVAFIIINKDNIKRFVYRNF